MQTTFKMWLTKFMNYLVCLIVICLYSCKERVSQQLENESAFGYKENLKALFESRGYSSELIDKFNDSTNIQWEPSWASQTIERKNDSLNLVYIPLIPRLINIVNGKIIRNAKFFGYTNYLVVATDKSKTFYLAKYTSEKFAEGPINFENFTGSLMYKNLASRESSILYYSLGKRIQRKSKSSSSSRTSSCVSIVTCSWGNWNCGAVNITSTTNEVSCDYPSWMPCFGAIWEINHSESVFSCPTDEPDPNNPGIPTVQPTTTELMINSHFKVSVPTESQNNVATLLDCIRNRRKVTGDKYFIRVKVDQPIANTSIPVTISTIAVGHAYLEFEVATFRGRYGTHTSSAGFWPNSTTTPLSPSSPGKIYDESAFPGSLDVEASFSVTYEEMNQVIDYVKSYGNQNYNLMTRNCGNMCSDALAQIGVNIPNGWQQTFWYSAATSGSPTSNNIYGPSMGAYGQVLKSFTHPKLSSVISSNVLHRQSDCYDDSF